MIKALLILIFAVSLFGGQFTKIYINKNHSLLTFAESLNGTNYVSEIPKQLYYKKFTRKSAKELIKYHKMITRARIYNYKNTKNLLEALYMESIKHSELKLLKKAMLKYKTSIGKKRLNRYFEILDDMAYIYENIIWSKNSKKLRYKKHQLIKIMEKEVYDDLILQVSKFYGVKEKNIEKMTIALYPIPKKSNIRAFSIKNVESIGIYPMGNKNLKWLLSATILHEISHTIYAKSPLIKKYFSDIKDKKTKVLINEVFATAIGAGWGYGKLSNKSSLKYQWYNNKRYDTSAKKIYPKIKSYLDKNKSLDKKLALFIKKELL